MIVLDETDCIVDATLRFTEFYAHESCGKCTPCREGTWWMARVLKRMETGYGRIEDIDLIKDVGHNMLFKSFCALADGAVSPLDSSIKFFRDEYEEHVRLGRCPLREESPGLAAASAKTGGTTGATAQVLPEGIEIELGEVLS
jgi:NADH-quinone oxidoreductase subunit F